MSGTLWTPVRYEPMTATLGGDAVDLAELPARLRAERGPVEIDYVVYRPERLRHIVRLTPGGGIDSVAATLGGTPLNYGHKPMYGRERGFLGNAADPIPRQGAVLSGGRLDEEAAMTARIRFSGDIVLDEMADGMVPRTSIEFLGHPDSFACSVCGADWFDDASECEHQPGATYDGARCYVDIDSADGAGVAVTYSPASTGTGPVGLSCFDTTLDTDVSFRNSGMDWLFPDWRLERMSEPTSKPRRRWFRFGSVRQDEGQPAEFEVEEIEAPVETEAQPDAELVAKLEQTEADLVAARALLAARDAQAETDSVEAFNAEVEGLMRAGVIEQGEDFATLAATDPDTLNSPSAVRALLLQAVGFCAARPDKGAGLIQGGSVPADTGRMTEAQKASAIEARAAELTKNNPTMSQLEAVRAARQEISR